MAIVSIASIFSGSASASSESDFWRWFVKNESQLLFAEGEDEEELDRLGAALAKVDKHLTFELGPVGQGKREFVISADGNRAGFPKVESLYAAAPSLPSWTLIKFRPRREPMDVNYGGIYLKAADVSVLVASSGQKAGIVMIIPGYTEAKRNTYFGLAFLLLDQALGEYDVETRVGAIDIMAAAPEGAPQPYSLSDLPTLVDSFYERRKPAQ